MSVFILYSPVSLSCCLFLKKTDPQSTSNQSSKPCTVLQYPPRRERAWYVDDLLYVVQSVTCRQLVEFVRIHGWMSHELTQICRQLVEFVRIHGWMSHELTQICWQLVEFVICKRLFEFSNSMSSWFSIRDITRRVRTSVMFGRLIEFVIWITFTSGFICLTNSMSSWFSIRDITIIQLIKSVISRRASLSSWCFYQEASCSVLHTKKCESYSSWYSDNLLSSWVLYGPLAQHRQEASPSSAHQEMWVIQNNT